MPKLSRPVRVGNYTIRGVDDWLAFMTDDAGKWYTLWTECSWRWPELPASFIGECGYPDTAEGVLATAMLELSLADCRPEPVNLEYVEDCSQFMDRRKPVTWARF